MKTGRTSRMFRDWSLITGSGREGYTMRGGGGSEVLPLHKEGGGAKKC